MNRNSAMNFPFPTCPKGHSLEGDNAFIIQRGDSRACRECVMESGVKRKRTERLRVI